MSSDSTASTRPGPKNRSSRDEVLRTAMRLVDGGEPGSFSMRLLADELGVAVMTLYGYVRDKEELYEALAVLALGEVEWDAVADTSWEAEICAAARGLRDVCRRHPNLVSVLLADRRPHPGLFGVRERMFTALDGAGFPTPTALRALGVCSSFALGFAIAETSETGRHLSDHLRVNGSEQAHSAGAIDRDALHVQPDTFEYGLELLIRGLRAERAAL